MSTDKMNLLEKEIHNIIETIPFDSKSTFPNLSINLRNEYFEHVIKPIKLTYQEFAILIASVYHLEITANDNERPLWKELRSYLSGVYFNNFPITDTTEMVIAMTDYIAYITRRVLGYYRDCCCDNGEMFTKCATIMGKIDYCKF